MQDHFGGVSQKHQNEKQRTIKMKAKTSQQNISEFFFLFLLMDSDLFSYAL